MRILIFCLTALILASCGSNYHLRRANYHLKKAELKGAVTASDTVFIEKRVIVPEVKTDTVFSSLEGDTVFLTKDRLKIKYVNMPGDSVYIEGKCESDTVLIKVPFTVTKTVIATKGFFFYLPWILVAVVVLAVVVIFRK